VKQTPCPGPRTLASRGSSGGAIGRPREAWGPRRRRGANKLLALRLQTPRPCLLAGCGKRLMRPSRSDRLVGNRHLGIDGGNRRVARGRPPSWLASTSPWQSGAGPCLAFARRLLSTAPSPRLHEEHAGIGRVVVFHLLQRRAHVPGSRLRRLVAAPLPAHLARAAKERREQQNASARPRWRSLMSRRWVTDFGHAGNPGRRSTGKSIRPARARDGEEGHERIGRDRGARRPS